jgi:hypothetical protein
VSKRLNQILVSKVLQGFYRYRSWINPDSNSDQHPIFIDLDQNDQKLETLFKFNSRWLEEEEFMVLIKDTWKTFDPKVENFVCGQFAATLKTMKEKVSSWAKERDTMKGAGYLRKLSLL